jgi:topoisomerase-4 subunit A
LADLENMVSCNKSGKAFITSGEGENLWRLLRAEGSSAAQSRLEATHVACASTGRRIESLKSMLKLMEPGAAAWCSSISKPTR